VCTPLVRGGGNVWFSKWEGGHGLVRVYSEMMTQCAFNYPGLPDPRTMTLDEIRYFYESLRPSLKQSTKNT